MKKLLAGTLLFIAVGLQAQNVGIGISSPNTSAKLDITATDKGLLIPRMDSVHRKAIPNTIGLLVYDSTTKSFWFNNGSAWLNMATAASGWSLTGNNALDAGTNFFGTTDNSPIVLKFNNQPAGKIDNGTVSIGAGAFSGNENTSPFLTAIGAGALHSNTLNPNTATGGYSNTAVGQNALFTNSTGNDNTGVGTFALKETTTGKYNTAVGSAAMQYNITGSSNTSLGYSALGNSLSGSNNTAVGASALLLNEGNQNTAVGVGALRINKADNNAAFGFNALAFNTIGHSNVAVGEYALNGNINGNDNTATGSNALRSNTNGTGNTAMGSGSSEKLTYGGGNTSFGVKTLTQNITGSWNTAIGANGLLSNKSNFNTAIGYSVMTLNDNGQANTAIGSFALGHNISGINNSALGYMADVAGVDLSNATAIGANATVDASNKIRLGDNNVTVVESNGVFNTVSDGRFKYNIQEDVKGLSFIMNLRPVTYQFDAKKQEDFTKGNLSADQLNNPVIPAAFNESNRIKRTGFIAQEVEKAAQKTGYDFDGVKIPATDKQYYSLSYASFVVPLVKAVQEQQQTIEALKKQNELLRLQNDLIIKRLEALEKK